MRSQQPVTEAPEQIGARLPVTGRAAYGWALGVAAVLIVLDRLTKIWAWSSLVDGPVVVFDPWLSFELAENRGAAFGLFQNGGQILAVFALVAVVVIALALRSVGSRWEAVALGMVLAGAVGNLIDRFVRGPGLVDGPVIDWIRFPNFPNFNVADSSITVGVGLLLLFSLIRRD